MPLEPGSEPKDLSVPDDYRVDHPQENPAEWGWHGEWGRASRVGGWICVVILLLMMTATHYNRMGTLFLGLAAIGLAAVLVRDALRRRNAWRD